ncbi:outer membrane protein assembly factor BamB family protein [Catellatospora tritici]|uniref:outer membrane protein assembly factor BamB family protein n=1 Tax=Catellatospora tritici TaxID=2851566 RepID=UPI001C2D8CFA|nr:PQQ-binding-like beta-propeller repeat protein [Catellatospora tritici]MBV1856206.1 PQQ-like beta-propeller repeat protein [Catellatospora tritici]
MSTDLDRLYAKLAAQADALTPPALDQVRRRARQRRRGNVLTVVTACVAVIGVLAGLRLLLAPPPPVEPLRPLPPAPATFTPFDASATPVLRYPSPVRFAMASTVDDRSYAMWMAEDGTEWVGGIDLKTSRALWPPLSLGKFGDTNGMVVSQSAILLLTEQGFDNPLVKDGSDTVIAVDPDTGRLAWTLPYSFNDCDWALFADTIVIGCQDRHTVEALDLRTGQTRWSSGIGAVQGGINPVRQLSEYYLLHGLSASPTRSGQVVLHLTDGKVQIRDAATGTVVKELSMPVLGTDTRRQEFAVDGFLYQFARPAYSRVPLDGSASPVEGTLGSGKSQVQPCGAAGRFCTVDNQSGERATVTMLDAVTGQTAWQVEIATQANDVIASPAGLLLVGQKTTVLGLDGSTLAEIDGQAMWLESGNLLVFESEAMFGFQLATQETIKLADFPSATRFCSWNSTMLTCPTMIGIGVYRYAR